MTSSIVTNHPSSRGVKDLANPPGLHLRIVDALDLAPEFGLKCNGDFDSIQEGFQLFHSSINSSSPLTCVM
jgi:hypothetical protein